MSQKVNRFIYHYCLMWQEPNRSMSYLDGIAQLKKRITSMDDYKELKKVAALDAPEGKATITNLSFIGMEFDEEVKPFDNDATINAIIESTGGEV